MRVNASIEQIRHALQRIHHVAIGDSDRAYMSIPANPKEDADLILSAAIDELEQLRARAAETAELLETNARLLDRVAEKLHGAS